MRICSIASGSSGNCIYLGTDATHLLVDVGISGKRTEAGLNGLGLTLADVDGILITHEHADHINGLGVLLRKREMPVYATAGTIAAIRNAGCLGDIPDDLFCEIREDDSFVIKDVTVNPMRISHDAAQPVAYRFRCDGKQAGIVTDLGEYNDYIVESGMDALVLEANHDVRMLEAGKYPYYLKRRILGDRGHLSNEMSGQLLSRLLHDNLQAVVLGHLSKENNYEELAYEAVRLEVTMGENPYKAGDFPMYVARRDGLSQRIAVQ